MIERLIARVRVSESGTCKGKRVIKCEISRRDIGRKVGVSEIDGESR